MAHAMTAGNEMHLSSDGRLRTGRQGSHMCVHLLRVLPGDEHSELQLALVLWIGLQEGIYSGVKAGNHIWPQAGCLCDGTVLSQ